MSSHVAPTVANPVRERLLFWIATNTVQPCDNLSTDGNDSVVVTSFVADTVRYLNSMPLNVGQAIAFVEAQQASEQIFRRAAFLANPEFNFYLPQAK